MFWVLKLGKTDLHHHRYRYTYLNKIIKDIIKLLVGISHHNKFKNKLLICIRKLKTSGVWK